MSEPMLSIVPFEAWEMLPADVQRKIGSVAIAAALGDEITKTAPDGFKHVGVDLRRKARAELLRHVTEAGISGRFPMCWSFLSDEERELL